MTDDKASAKTGEKPTDTNMSMGSGCAYAVGLILVALTNPLIWLTLVGTAFGLAAAYRYAVGLPIR